MTRLAESQSENRFRKVKVKGEAFMVCGLEVWMPKAGDMKLVVSREKTASAST